MSKPIRVGLIGLTSTPPSLTGRWAEDAHLPYLIKSPDYVITALCNSSVASAQKAIERHNLDASKVKAYGDPVSIANDPNVDMVVCSVMVEKHYELVKPALEAGKDVYCEWPLASNLDQMTELAALAKEKKVRTVVGLQERVGSYVPAIQSLIGDGPGKIGTVLSTVFSGHTQFFGSVHPQDITYLAKIETGGNLVTIPGIHLLDMLTLTLGDIESFSSVAKNKRPTVALVDDKYQVVDPQFKKTSHDHFFVNGSLKGDVPFSFTLRGGFPFKGTDCTDWRIYGSKGEIRLTSSSSGLWGDAILKLQVYLEETQQVEEVDLAKSVDVNDPGYGVKSPADDIARLYAAFAKQEKHKYVDFEGSVKWAKFIQKVYDDASK